jgi:hypothetical protein
MPQEPHTTTPLIFIRQSWTEIPLTGFESPAIQQVRVKREKLEEVRNLHSFLADSGTETRQGA